MIDAGVEAELVGDEAALLGADFSSGFAPDSVLTGSMRSVGLKVAAHLSHESPY